MYKLSRLTTNEMIDEYYVAKIDTMVCARINIVRFTERIVKNYELMKLIEIELARRGDFDRLLSIVGDDSQIPGDVLTIINNLAQMRKWAGDDAEKTK